MALFAYKELLVFLYWVRATNHLCKYMHAFTSYTKFTYHTMTTLNGAHPSIILIMDADPAPFQLIAVETIHVTILLQKNRTAHQKVYRLFPMI